MAHTRNAALATRIAELGLTELQVSDLLNDAKERVTGRRGRCTDRYVRLLLDGTIRWPWLVNRQALEQVLDKPILELGFIPRSDRSLVRQSSAGPLLGDPSDDGRHTNSMCPDNSAGQDISRQDTAQQGEVLAIGEPPVHITVPAVPQCGRIGRSDIERLRGPLAKLVDIDQRLGGVGLAPACARLAGQVLEAIRAATATDQVQHALHAVAGEYLAAAGWACIDAMELDQASSYLDRALKAAHAACDPMLHAMVTNLVVMRSRTVGDHAHAHLVASGGLNSTAARANPRVKALFHARLAHGLAIRGEFGAAERELGRARQTLTRVTSFTPAPAWLAFFGQAELAALSAGSYHKLGRYREATEQATEATALVLPGYRRNKTLYTLSLAEALLAQREIEHAAAHAHVGLQLAGQLRRGLQPSRVDQRLRDVRRQFAQWPEVCEARQWIAEHDSMSTHNLAAFPDNPANNHTAQRQLFGRRGRP